MVAPGDGLLIKYFLINCDLADPEFLNRGVAVSEYFLLFYCS